jgi:hypothetical protein
VIVPAAHGISIAEPALAFSITPTRAIPREFTDGHRVAFRVITTMKVWVP